LANFIADDYGWQAFSSIEGKQVEDKVADVETKPQRCLCAAATCTGFLEKQEPQKQVQTTKGRKKKVCAVSLMNRDFC
jgi:hypothetical protein